MIFMLSSVLVSSLYLLASIVMVQISASNKDDVTHVQPSNFVNKGANSNLSFSRESSSNKISYESKRDELALHYESIFNNATNSVDTNNRRNDRKYHRILYEENDNDIEENDSPFEFNHVDVTEEDIGNNQFEEKSPQFNAQKRMQVFFDDLLQMEQIYGTNLITVEDAPDMHPILSSSSDLEDCPFRYTPLKENVSPPNDIASAKDFIDGQKSNACFTPIVTIFDRVANSWPASFSSTPVIKPERIPSEQLSQDPPRLPYVYNAQIPQVLLVSGIDDSIEEMDILGPSSILETVRLLLDCAICESASPWVPDNTNSTKDEILGPDHDDNERDKNEGASNKTFSGTESPSSTRTDSPPHSRINAIQCRKDLESRGINDMLRRWLARLVTTRKIVAVPMADARSFFQKLVGVEAEKVSRRRATQGLVDTSTVSDEHGGKKNDLRRNVVQNLGSECDYPFPLDWKISASNTETPSCMNTFPARLMNELFRSHSFQMGLSFHGSWRVSDVDQGWIGIPRWKNRAELDLDDSPPAIKSFDEAAMLEISWAYSAFGAIHDSHISAPHDLNEVGPYTVLPDDVHSESCRGASMERWAFSAGSQFGNYGMRMQPCRCESAYENSTDGNDGTCAYTTKRTTFYDDASLRSFIAGVVAPPELETFNTDCLPGFTMPFSSSCVKIDSSYLFANSRIGNNLRMSLLMTEMVEPWTSVRSVAGVDLRDDDKIPLSPRLPGMCPLTRAMTLPESPLMRNITISWAVGGAIGIDETAIMYGKWDVLDKKIFDCISQPTKNELDSFFTILRDFEAREGKTAEEMMTEVSFTTVQKGFTRWHSSQIKNIESLRSVAPETIFSVNVDLSRYKVGDKIAIYSLARVDQYWMTGIVGTTPAQSNFVNARTNPEWSSSNRKDGSSINGRLDFFSVPITIEIGPQPGFFEANTPIEVSVRPSDEAFVTVEQGLGGVIAYALVMAVLVIAAVFFCVFVREPSDGTDVFR
ncbi:hypothetical protein ACHAXS_009387 [Conticribra weissflogii]